MTEIKLIEIREEILKDNLIQADDIRARLKGKKIFLLNLMSSPGSGKTSLILKTISALGSAFRIAVIEGDIESMVDAERVVKTGTPAVQLRTGGACHLDAPMIDSALNKLPLDDLDLVIIENVGNLVCPAEFDTGAMASGVILSIPEGDDKPLKYPLIFTTCQIVIINKMDYLEGSDFDLDAFRQRVRRLNPQIRIIEVSCKTGSGLESWTRWLRDTIEAEFR